MRVTATLLVLLLLLCHVPRAWAFLLIDQPFVFGDLELEGLRIFRDEKRGNWSLAPQAREPFRAVAAATAPGRTDLGTWNLVQNPEFPNRRLQRHLARMVCASQGPLAACRRPGRTGRGVDRALQDAWPAHAGSVGAVPPHRREGHARGRRCFYVKTSALARAGQLRNGAHELRDMDIGEADVAPLAAFLRSLNEDYE